MLRNLKIKNLALVDDAKVGFNDGLNVITGETVPYIGIGIYK